MFLSMPAPDVPRLESLLDLFRKIDAVARAAEELRVQVNQQMMVCRRLDSIANPSPASVAAVNIRQREPSAEVGTLRRSPGTRHR